ncbi:MAG: glucose-6-phosphate dehydrogenase assembly protein OpcA [Chloroflexi bacterium]|nr:glucose-6-phosphate dehydrogenase assembly protein OpcA [Chloroflexota bacterium]
MVVDNVIWGAPASGVSALERELARLRRARSAHASEQGHTVARASVLNLVVFATREVHAKRAARTIADLSQRHPSRAIVVWVDRPGSTATDRLAMHCDLPRADGREQVSCEQILVRAPGDAGARLASAVIPLLLPDLPVFLWWTDTPPFDAPHFDAMLELADRFIIDSADFARPELSLKRVREVCARGSGRYGVTDFNWTRLTPWRDLVSAFFDVPAWRPYLDSITGVRVGFTVDADGREVHPSQALLLVGWLASRLGWLAAQSLAPSEAGGMLFSMTRGDGTRIPVRVRPRFERGLEEGDLSGLRIQATRDGKLAEFVVKRAAGNAHVTTSVIIDGSLVTERVMPLSAPRVGDLLGEELTIVASDHVYEDALAALVALS